MRNFIPTLFVSFPGSVGVGWALIVLGLLLALAAGRTLRRAGTTVLPGKPSTRLVVAGPYSFTRNRTISRLDGPEAVVVSGAHEQDSAAVTMAPATVAPMNHRSLMASTGERRQQVNWSPPDGAPGERKHQVLAAPRAGL
ncbi:MAG: hypothetical protein ABSB35_28775 [Bryobacteraceae bacterium]